MVSTSTIRQYVLDILFPVTCLSCKKEGAWLCKACVSLIAKKDEHACPICTRVATPFGRTCFGCRKKSFLDALLPAFPYDQPLIRRAVHYYKYRFIPHLHVPLADLLAAALIASDLPLPDIIIPVPLHPRRLRWRGFNQSELLAVRLGAHLAPGFTVPVRTDMLSRKKYTLPQMNIKIKSQRLGNIKDAFAFSSSSGNVAGKNILLVDDVATTGATLFECARVLKKAGVGQVWAVVIARQELKPAAKTAKGRLQGVLYGTHS